MTAGELFVKLGIKGSEKTVAAISGVKKGLGETASVSLEAKAAILAAMYAMERLFAISGAAGTGLANFNALVGVAPRTLQQYQFAARQMGVSNQEVEASFKSLQAVMTKTLLGEGAPKGMARLAQLTGDMAPADIERFQKNPELLMQKLQQYALKEKNAGLRNDVLKSFGIGDGLVAAMARDAFRPDVFRKAPVYGDKEIAALDRANIAWSNLGVKIEMAIGRFNVKHGGEIVRDITKIADAVLRLAEALVKAADKFKIFDKLASLTNFVADAIDSKPGTVLGEKHLETKMFDFFFKDAKDKENKDSTYKEIEKIKPIWDPSHYGAPTPQLEKMVAPPVAPGSSSSSSIRNVNVNQSLTFQHDGTDHKKTADSHRKAAQNAFRQFPQGQVS